MAVAKVYLDNCCFNRPYDDQSQVRISIEAQAKMFVQEAIKSGKLKLVTSYILRYENAQNPYEIRKNGIERFIRKYASVYVSSSEIDNLHEKTLEIMASGVKPKDAQHVSCAIYAGCDYFLTTDDRLLKYKSEDIKMRNPVEFVNEMEGELL